MTVQLISNSTKIGLFNRLGKLFYAHERLRTAATNFATDLDSISALYRLTNGVSASTDADLTMISNLLENRNTLLGFIASIQSELEEAAKTTIIDMVDSDVPLASKTVYTAMSELRRQMEASTSTLDANAISTAGPISSGNTGNALMYSTTIPSQLEASTLSDDNPYVRTETLTLRCTADSNSSAALGAELFSVNGASADANDWYEWPAGSGTSTTLASTSATIDLGGSAGQNILVNGDMESFSANVPDNWTVKVGTAGTDFERTTSAGEFYDGLSALQFTGNGSVLMNLSQSINSASGTTTALLPDTPYVLLFRVKRGSSQPTAGVLKLQIENESGGSIIPTANSGTATISVDCTNGTALSTAYQTKSLVFRTTLAPGSSVRLSIEFTTALSNTHEVFVDGVALVRMFQPAAGSSAFAIVAGNTATVVGDRFTATYTNDYGGKFYRELDRFFDLYSNGNMLPGTASTPTVADSLIG